MPDWCWALANSLSDADRGPRRVDRRGRAIGMRDEHLRGALPPQATQRQMDVLAAYVAAGGSVPDAAELVGIRASTVKRHLADLRARSGLTTEQLIYSGRAAGWLVVPSLDPG
jgi:DNA-binding NarL/FixJ family response regulator